MPSSRPACDECGGRGLEHRARVAGAHLGADARLAHRHDRVGEADRVDAELEQAVRHAHGERGIAEHHRDDRVLAGHQVEARGREPRAEPGGVVARAVVAAPDRDSSRSSTASVVAATTGAIVFEKR